jgi:hypothetical protein
MPLHDYSVEGVGRSAASFQCPALLLRQACKVRGDDSLTKAIPRLRHTHTR